MRFLYARFTNRKTHATLKAVNTHLHGQQLDGSWGTKKFVKSPCYVTIDISRAFPPKQTQVKICLQIQRELSGGQFSLSLYLKLFRTISNSSYNTTASSRHRSVWKKKITEKKISALAEGLDSKFFVIVSTSCVCANHSEIFPRSRLSWPAF